MPPKKQGEKSSTPQNLKPFVEYQYAVYINLLEIGNLLANWNNITLKAEHADIELSETKANITTIENCHCSILYANYQWVVKIPIEMNEESLYELTSYPVLIHLEYLDNGTTTPHLKTFGHFKINLIPWIQNLLLDENDPNKLTNKIEIIKYENIPKAEDIQTWPNLPYIKYNIEFEPFLSNYIIEKECEQISFTFEYILNAHQDMLNSNFILAYLLLSVNETDKIIVGKNPKVQEIKDMFSKVYKINNSLSNYEGNLRYSNEKICTDLSKKNLNIPEKITIQDELDESMTVISFQTIHKCVLPRDAIINMLDRPTLEIFINISNEQDGIPQITLNCSVPMEHFKFVNVNQIRFCLPLMKIISNNSKSNVKLIQIVENREEILNEDLMNTCLIMEIKFEKPLLQLREDKTEYLHETHFGGTSYNNIKNRNALKLEDIFKNDVIDKFLIENRFKDIKNINRIDVNCDNKLMETVSKLCFDNFNFDIETEDDAMEVAENIMIHLNDAIYDMNNDDEIKHKSREYRLKNALTCFEFGFYDEAEDFYRMNIHDFPNIQHMCYLDYAIYNLFLNQIQMVKVALDKIISIYPYEYTTNFLFGYIALLDKKYQESERIFKFLTELYPIAFESLIALQFLYILEEKFELIENIDDRLENLVDTIQGRQFLHKQPDVLWIPKRTNDVKIDVIKHFIQIGCFLLAEIGLGYLVHQYGENSFELNYHMALISYYNKNYSIALQHLAKIKTGSIDRDKRFLIINCLIEMNSKNGIMEYKRYRMKKQKQKCSEVIINLLYLKFGRFYLERSKYKTARYFFKKSCFLSDSYVAFRMLGITAFKLNSLELAELCFNTIYRINPFNKITWEMLTQIFEKKNLQPQYETSKSLLMS